jgi:fermentation-respiration switch protein FrsA (DUF1100 family)
MHSFTRKITAALALALSLSSCSSVLYYPSKERYFDPAKAGMSHEDVWLRTPDGSKIHGWYLKNPVQARPKATIIFFHGNAENLTTHFASLAWILPHGYDYFIWDYRGYGQSEGQADPENTVRDGMLVVREIHKRNEKTPLILFGQSLGGAVALRTQIELGKSIPIRLTVIDSSFASYQEAGRHVLSHHWLTWLGQPLAYLLLSDRWAPADRVLEIAPVPLVVIHGRKDGVVDFELGRDLFEKAREPKEFWEIENGLHTDVFWRHGEIYREKLLKRLEAALYSE